jgi:hypothetical protein
VAQVVKHQPSKHEALSSTTILKKKERVRKGIVIDFKRD